MKRLGCDIDVKVGDRVEYKLLSRTGVERGECVVEKIGHAMSCDAIEYVGRDVKTKEYVVALMDMKDYLNKRGQRRAL